MCAKLKKYIDINDIDLALSYTIWEVSPKPIILGQFKKLKTKWLILTL